MNNKFNTTDLIYCKFKMLLWKRKCQQSKDRRDIYHLKMKSEINIGLFSDTNCWVGKIEYASMKRQIIFS